ncbi:MAG: hypothetical protein J6D21_12300 [Clostridia bacterium]|nr:hypothetical protein [Clostridia bacterium]
MVTKEQIKSSLDAKWQMSQTKIYSAILGGILIFLLLIALVSGASYGNFALSFEVSGICAAVFAVIFAPFPLYSLYRYRELFRGLEEYRVYTTTLDQPNTSHLYRGAIYYTVTLRAPDGSATKTDTNPLFSSGAFASFPLEEYNNQTVTVAYKESEDLLVILDMQKG